MKNKELKTLNDLKEQKLGGYKGMIFKYDLKAEAVKDIKAIEEKKGRWNRKDVINYIKWKNNITKEDLK